MKEIKEGLNVGPAVAESLPNTLENWSEQVIRGLRYYFHPTSKIASQISGWSDSFNLGSAREFAEFRNQVDLDSNSESARFVRLVDERQAFIESCRAGLESAGVIGILRENPEGPFHEKALQAVKMIYFYSLDCAEFMREGLDLFLRLHYANEAYCSSQEIKYLFDRYL